MEVFSLVATYSYQNELHSFVLIFAVKEVATLSSSPPCSIYMELIFPAYVTAALWKR